MSDQCPVHGYRFATLDWTRTVFIGLSKRNLQLQVIVEKCVHLLILFVEGEISNIFYVVSVLLALRIKVLGCTGFHRSQEFPTDGHKTLTGLSQVCTQHIALSVEGLSWGNWTLFCYCQDSKSSEEAEETGETFRMRGELSSR